MIRAPLWQATTGGDVQSSPAVANGVVYVGLVDRKLYAFDAQGIVNCAGNPKTCTPLLTTDTNLEVFSSPAVANGKVYVGSFGTRAFRLP
ncbi:MAG: PQQ-binding-like beta-propeller repeat protein [Actinomycetota bacterium]|nr:PQQ-binding-like beta-propeller repeat protein [Actinomycetota bacterium]